MTVSAPTPGPDVRPPLDGARAVRTARRGRSAGDPARADAEAAARPAALADLTVPVALHPVLARLATDPGGPMLLGVTGTGGTGKTTVLAAVRAAYRSSGTPVRSWRAGVSGGRPGTPEPAASPLLVDDAHLLPEPALERLLALAERDDGRLVVALRPWPRPPLLVELVRELGTRSGVVELGALDRAQVAARAAMRLGRTPPASLVDHVLRATAGIPRLVELVLAGTVGGGAALNLSPRPTAALPWDLLAQLDQDLGPTGGPLRAVTLALAVGTAPEPGTLASVLGLEPAQVTDLLGQARAAGLLRPDGTLVPVARQAVLAATPADRARSVLGASIRTDLSRGVGAVEVARRVGVGALVSGELAAVLERAGDELRSTDPAHAADLFEAAARAGAATRTTARRAECEALAGDLDAALRLTDGVLAGPVTEETAAAVQVAAAALAHRGLLGRGAELHTWLAAQQGTADPLAPLFVLGSGLPDHPAAAGRAAAAGPGRPTLGAAAQTLLAEGVRRSLAGDGSAALPAFSQASALLGSGGGAVLLPDTPDALGALAALSGGEPGHAERALRHALATGQGGDVARPRHHLLLAWSAMLAGRFDDARAAMTQALRGGRPLEARDELFHSTLELGIARRTNDLAELVRSWPGAREALLNHGTDLFMLLPLGEIAVAAARLDQTHRIAAHLAAADDLLARTGHPVLWAVPMHWYGVHAAIGAERPDQLEPHATALVQGAQVSRYSAGLAEAGKVWMQVLAGRVDAVAVERTARRLHSAGLGWDGSRLAVHAAARTTDGRTVSHLMQVARDLHRSGPAGERPQEPPAQAVHAVRDAPTEATIHLTERELEVAHLVLAGHTYREISERLYISAKTVEHHVARMRQRLGLTSRAELLAHLRVRLAPRPEA